MILQQTREAVRQETETPEIRIVPAPALDADIDLGFPLCRSAQPEHRVQWK
jgi:hypothetical protein